MCHYDSIWKICMDVEDDRDKRIECKKSLNKGWIRCLPPSTHRVCGVCLNCVKAYNSYLWAISFWKHHVLKFLFFAGRILIAEPMRDFKSRSNRSIFDVTIFYALKKCIFSTTFVLMRHFIFFFEVTNAYVSGESWERETLRRVPKMKAFHFFFFFGKRMSVICLCIVMVIERKNGFNQ